MPKGLGLNSYASIEHHRFSTIDDAVKLIKPGVFLAKIDIKSAYRSVPISPSNYCCTGLKWKFHGDSHFSYLIDTRLPFGAKRAPGIFHRITQSIRRMMLRRGFTGIIVYLDDFLVVGKTKQECKEAYDTLCQLLQDLGFTLSAHKLVPPCQRLVFLGIVLDSLALTLSIPQNKLSEIKDKVKSFLCRQRATKRQLQSLAGKLNWAAKVVYGGRTFLRRILDMMNQLEESTSKRRLTLEFHRDLLWWHQFLDTFNGCCPFLEERPIVELQTDACPVAAGAFYNGDWIYSCFAIDCPSVADLHINFKETFAIVYAAIRWGRLWTNHHVIVHSDNLAAVAIINKGTTRNAKVMSHLRLLFWLSAQHNFRITARYIKGVDNDIADQISRLHEPYMFLKHISFLCQYFLSSIGDHLQLLSHMTYHSYLFLLSRFIPA